MRIRAVRPDYWSDDVLGRLGDPVRLFYIGLWCVADDAGWLEWKPAQIGATLYPYRPTARRERDIEQWGDTLVQVGRIVRYPCGCALIPTMTKHQRSGGNPSYQVRDKHRLRHTDPDESVLVSSDTPVGKVKVSKDRGGFGGTNESSGKTDDWSLRVIETQRKGGRPA